VTFTVNGKVSSAKSQAESARDIYQHRRLRRARRICGFLHIAAPIGVVSLFFVYKNLTVLMDPDEACFDMIWERRRMRPSSPFVMRTHPLPMGPTLLFSMSALTIKRSAQGLSSAQPQRLHLMSPPYPVRLRTTSAP
jgi:hypothetical protein